MFSHGNKEKLHQLKSLWLMYIQHIYHIFFSHSQVFRKKKYEYFFVCRSHGLTFLVIRISWAFVALYPDSVDPGLGLWRLLDLFRPIILRKLQHLAQASHPNAFSQDTNPWQSHSLESTPS